MARLDFLESILPHFERLLPRNKQRYQEKITTAVLCEDENFPMITT